MNVRARVYQGLRIVRPSEAKSEWKHRNERGLLSSMATRGVGSVRRTKVDWTSQGSGGGSEDILAGVRIALVVRKW